MAPYLFLFFAEAMSSYIAADTVGLQGLHLSSATEDLLDLELADATSIYVQGNISNLLRLAEGSYNILCRLRGKIELEQDNWILG
mgnify:CR=1 FL=1